MNTTTTTTVNTSKVEQMLATQVVDARAALAEAKRIASEAEDAFRALGVDSVELTDGTKVAIVRQNRRAVDTEAVKAIVPKGQFQRLTRREATLALIDEAIKAGWLDEATIAPAISVKETEAVKVTQPKRS